MNRRKPSGYYKSIDNILSEARIVQRELCTEILPSADELAEAGYSGLAGAISKYSSWWEVRTLLGEDSHRKIIRSHWEKPVVIEREARKFMREKGLKYFPSLQELRRIGRYDLINATHRHYPGQFRALREKLGKDPEQREQGSWKSIDYVVEECEGFMEEHGFDTLPSERTMEELGRKDLSHGITRYHGMVKVRRRLGEKAKPQKPTGYWQNPQNILREAQGVMKRYKLKEFPTHEELERRGYSTLRVMISKYPGGKEGLLRDLGFEVKKQVRTQEQLTGFLEHEHLAREIAPIIAANGYAGDVASIFIAIWPKLFPSASELARSLPGAVKGISHAITPFSVTAYKRFCYVIPKMPKDVRPKMEEILYQLMISLYQRDFNENPQRTIRGIEKLTRGPRLDNKISRRVLEYYREVYDFRIPGHGIVRDYAQ